MTMTSLGRLAVAAVLCGTVAAVHAQLSPSPAPEGAAVYFVSPQHGDVVEGTFTVSFGLQGMGVAPAGVEMANTGHHHLLINVDRAELDMTRPLPATDQVRHFGGGQTEATVTLPPGEHTLQLLLGNFLHVPHDPAVLSETITVTVQPAL